MRKLAPVVFDATHSVQLPSAGAENGDGKPVQSGGQPEFIPLLARAAVAAGVDGVFVEVHDNPPQALSDSANALDLKLLAEVLDQLIAVHNALQ
jgi:2-dehydro-3-deoxyphosphooctonate aldolase (KDO 8-P synthase)